MIEHSELINEISKALLQAQGEILAAKKTSENPYFKSKYADLAEVIEAVKGPLNKNKIVFLQAVNENGERALYVETILLHESGQFFCSKTPVYCVKQNDPQALGTGITYSKRYALQAILGLPTEDDDAENAMDRGPKPAGPTSKPAFAKPRTDQPKPQTGRDKQKKPAPVKGESTRKNNWHKYLVDDGKENNYDVPAKTTKNLPAINDIALFIYNRIPGNKPETFNEQVVNDPNHAAWDSILQETTSMPSDGLKDIIFSAVGTNKK